MLREETPCVQDISGDSNVAVSALPDGVAEMLDDVYASQQCELSAAELDVLYVEEMGRRDTERLVAASQFAAVALVIGAMENRRSGK